MFEDDIGFIPCKVLFCVCGKVSVRAGSRIKNKKKIKITKKKDSEPNIWPTTG